MTKNILFQRKNEKSIEEKLRDYRRMKAESLQKEKLVETQKDVEHDTQVINKPKIHEKLFNTFKCFFISIFSLISSFLNIFFSPVNYVVNFISSSSLYCELSSYLPTWLLVTIKVSVWLSTWAFFIYIQFGTVFFVISLILFMCLNTRTREKLEGEPSAYSVFNNDMQTIPGTVTAEQLERQLFYGI